jgi:hypothetical protein
MFVIIHFLLHYMFLITLYLPYILLQQSFHGEATNELLLLSYALKENRRFYFQSLQNAFNPETTFPETSHLLIS